MHITYTNINQYLYIYIGYNYYLPIELSAFMILEDFEDPRATENCLAQMLF